MLNRSFQISSLVFLALAAGLHLFFFSRGFYSIGLDASGRTVDAYQWAAHGTVMTKAWLPFYRVFVGLGLKALPDLFLTPRIISFLYGLAAIPAAGWLADELFQSRKITLLTLALSTFFSQRIALSLAPLSSIMFTFMILVACALLARWLRTSQRSVLLVSAVFCALASTLQYEGWVFGVILFLVAAGYCRFEPRRLEQKDLLLLGLILFSFPIVWTASTFAPANAIRTVVTDARQFSSREILRRNPLVEFVLTNAFTLNLIGVISVFQFIRGEGWRPKAIVAASFAPLVVISVVLLVLRSAQTGPSWRMITVWSMLLLPFTARLLAGYSWPFSGTAGKALASSAAVLVLSAFLYDTFRIERNSTQWFPESDRLAGQYLSDLIAANPDTKILIESSKYFFLNIQVASQHPDAFVRNSVPNQQSVPVLPPGGSIRGALEKRGIEFLMFREGEYKGFLNRSPEVARLKDFGSWSIYKLAD